MSATVPRELMILVERVVRPLPIPLSRQKRLRTEFLEHLQFLYAEELASDNDPVAALCRTQARFGVPQELTAELCDSICWWERWEYWLQLRLEQQAWESTAVYVLRMMTMFVSFLLILIAGLMADHHFFGTERVTVLKLKVAAAAVAFLAIWMGGLLTFGLLMGAEWERQRRRWSRIMLYSGCMTASWGLSMACMMQIAGGSWSDYSAPFAASIVGGIMTVATGTVIGVFHRRDTTYRREWAELELDAA